MSHYRMSRRTTSLLAVGALVALTGAWSAPWVAFLQTEGRAEHALVSVDGVAHVDVHVAGLTELRWAPGQTHLLPPAYSFETGPSAQVSFDTVPTVSTLETLAAVADQAGIAQTTVLAAPDRDTGPAAVQGAPLTMTLLGPGAGPHDQAATIAAFTDPRLAPFTSLAVLPDPGSSRTFLRWMPPAGGDDAHLATLLEVAREHFGAAGAVVAETDVDLGGPSTAHLAFTAAGDTDVRPVVFTAATVVGRYHDVLAVTQEHNGTLTFHLADDDALSPQAVAALAPVAGDLRVEVERGTRG